MLLFYCRLHYAWIWSQNWITVIVFLLSYLSCISYCIFKSLMSIGCRSWEYLTALSRGKPLEWNEMRQSQIGHFSTGSLRMMSSSNCRREMCSNLSNLTRISCMGLDLHFLAMAQMPTMTCAGGSTSSKSTGCYKIKVRTIRKFSLIVLIRFFFTYLCSMGLKFQASPEITGS